MQAFPAARCWCIFLGQRWLPQHVWIGEHADFDSADFVWELRVVRIDQYAVASEVKEELELSVATRSCGFKQQVCGQPGSQTGR